MSSAAEVGEGHVPRPGEVADFYDDGMSRLLAELAGGSLHLGYWDGPSDESTMAAASTRLTDVMAERIGVGVGDRVLDLGCGTGAPAVRLAETTGATVVGLTNSPVQARLATERVNAAGLTGRVSVRCADVMELSLPEASFDAVWMIESISHLPDRLAALRLVRRLLKPGGRVAIADVLDGTPASATVQDSVDRLDARATSRRYSALMARPIRLAEYTPLLERAGLVPVDLADVTGNTVAQTRARMRQRLSEDRAALVREFGEPVVALYESVLPLQESVTFGYGIVVAAAP